MFYPMFSLKKKIFKLKIVVFVTVTFILSIFLTIATQNLSEHVKKLPNHARRNYSEWSFKDYLKKFDTITVWETMGKGKQKINWKDIKEHEIDEVVEKIDPIDELLNMDFDNVEIKNPELLKYNSRRTWYPPGLILKPDASRDAYFLRPRLYDLMKQAIYQARDKMIFMQELRAEYRNNSLYKMGFLISKTDETTKLLSQVAYRAWRHCDAQRRHGNNFAYPIYEMMESEERVINLWFELDMLIDLIRRNDERCNMVIANIKKVMAKYERLKHNWFKD